MSKRRRISGGLVNKLYRKLASLSALHRIGIKISRDPLHHRYEVNRHGIKINILGQSSPERMRAILVSDLIAEGWTHQQQYGMDCYTMNYRGCDVGIFVGTNFRTDGGLRFDLMSFTLDLHPS